MKNREWAATALLFTSALTVPACGGGTDGDGGAGASELAVTHTGADARIDPAMVGTFHYEPLGAPSTPAHIPYRPNPLFKSDETREEQLGTIQLKADGTFTATLVVWVPVPSEAGGPGLLDVAGTWETRGEGQFTLTYPGHDQNQKAGTWHDTFVWTTTSDPNERYVGFLGDGRSPRSDWPLRDQVPNANWFTITR